MTEPWPRRPRLVAGNWKMNTLAPESVQLARSLVERLGSAAGCAVAVCPPFPALAGVGEALMGSSVLLGAQNVHPEARGAFTGEVAAPMLTAIGCRMVIVGHSERRHGMGEDDALVARKLRAALREPLTPIVCVGETLHERDRGEVAEVVTRQVTAAFAGLTADEARRVVIAYEPVWAIGTGRVATPDQAREAHVHVRAALDRAGGSGLGAAMAVLYGGSVTADNAASLFAEAEIDGALVGGASLDAGGFARIVAAAAAAKP